MNVFYTDNNIFVEVDGITANFCENGGENRLFLNFSLLC